jgi:hypothetical protein
LPLVPTSWSLRCDDHTGRLPRPVTGRQDRLAEQDSSADKSQESHRTAKRPPTEAPYRSKNFPTVAALVMAKAAKQLGVKYGVLLPGEDRKIVGPAGGRGIEGETALKPGLPDQR